LNYLSGFFSGEGANNPASAHIAAEPSAVKISGILTVSPVSITVKNITPITTTKTTRLRQLKTIL
jgi:hypothetical protein